MQRYSPSRDRALSLPVLLMLVLQRCTVGLHVVVIISESVFIFKKSVDIRVFFPHTCELGGFKKKKGKKPVSRALIQHHYQSQRYYHHVANREASAPLLCLINVTCSAQCSAACSLPAS